MANYLQYMLDIKEVPITREEPLPVRIIIDIPKINKVITIDTEDLLKHQIDFQTNKFKVLGILDAQGGSAILENDQIIFTPFPNGNNLMKLILYLKMNLGTLQ